MKAEDAKRPSHSEKLENCLGLRAATANSGRALATSKGANESRPWGSAFALYRDFQVLKVDARKPMNHHIKRFLFKYYALVSVTTFGGALVLYVFGTMTW